MIAGGSFGVSDFFTAVNRTTVEHLSAGRWFVCCLRLLDFTKSHDFLMC